MNSLVEAPLLNLWVLGELLKRLIVRAAAVWL